MSLRRFSPAVALVLVVAVAVVWAQPQVTVVLTNGQRYVGSLVYRNNTVGLVTANGVRSWPTRNVAVIEFTPGQPDPAELSQVNTQSGFLTSAPNVLVLQDGEVITGRNVSISADGNQVSIDTPDGRHDYMASDIARLYVNTSAAQKLFAMNRGSSGAVGTSGQAMQGQGTVISVPANQHWTATGIQVREGDQLAFRASGQIHWGPQASEVARPQGGRVISPNYPVPTAGVGALIGRVGNGQPFLVPANGETLTIPATGELYLGVNDDEVSDNSGNYQVQIVRAGGQ